MGLLQGYATVARSFTFHSDSGDKALIKYFYIDTKKRYVPNDINQQTKRIIKFPG